MLLLIRNLCDLNYSQLMAVYEESNRKNGTKLYPRLDKSEQLLLAEQDFYDYLREMFRDGVSVCAVWASQGRYMACLRLEPYRDGVLVTGLETAPDARKKGYATCLLQEVVQHFYCQPIYSHIEKKNNASLRVHEKCGFQCVADHAVYLDGSYVAHAYTYLHKK